MAEQKKWLQENSPYRYHKSKRNQFSIDGCCGREPEEDGSEILHHHPETDEMVWFVLHRCSVCGRYYIALNGKWKLIENPIRYERRAKDCNLDDDMVR